MAELPEDEVIAALEEAVRVAVVEERPSPPARWLPLRPRLLPPDPVRGDHRAAPTALASAVAEPWSRLSDVAWTSTPPSWPSTSPTPPTGRPGQGGRLRRARRPASDERLCLRRSRTRLLEQALEVQEVLDPAAKTQRCDLLLALGEAMLPTDQPRRVAETVASEAFALAEAQPGFPACRAGSYPGARWDLSGPGPDMAEFAEWATRADRHAADASAERAYADTYLGFQSVMRGKPAEGHVYLRRAVERASELGEEAAFLTAAGPAVTFLNALSDLDFVERLAEEFQRRPHATVRAADLAAGLESVGRRLLGRTQREIVEQVWRELDQLAEQSRDPTAVALAASARATREFVDGRLELAASVGQSAVSLANAAGIALTWNTTFGRARMLPAQALFYLGRATEALLSEFHGPTRPELAERTVRGVREDPISARARPDSSRPGRAATPALRRRAIRRAGAAHYRHRRVPGHAHAAKPGARPATGTTGTRSPHLWPLSMRSPRVNARWLGCWQAA